MKARSLDNSLQAVQGQMVASSDQVSGQLICEHSGHLSPICALNGSRSSWRSRSRNAGHSAAPPATSPSRRARAAIRRSQSICGRANIAERPQCTDC